jgi:hypothetical protein
VRPQNSAAFEAAFIDVPWLYSYWDQDNGLEVSKAAPIEVPYIRLGSVSDNGRLVIRNYGEVVIESDLAALNEAWQKPLRWQ